MMTFLTEIDWLHLSYAFLLATMGYFIARQLSRITDKTMSKRFSRHQASLAKRLVFYLIFLIFIISALQQLGFKMTVLLGAAGVFTVALSFASQTAASNLVSGIFLLFEHPFKVGDVIQVKGLTGTVDSIDLLSTKILTADNMRIRIPNESIMKSDITNMSYFNKRRVDIIISVAYATDIEQAKTILIGLAKSHEKVLSKPLPDVIIDKFADSAIELKFMVWAKTTEVASVKNQLHELIKKEFEVAGIEMPFPQLTLHQNA